MKQIFKMSNGQARLKKVYIKMTESAWFIYIIWLSMYGPAAFAPFHLFLVLCIPGNIKNMYCKEIDTGFYMCYTTKH